MPIHVTCSACQGRFKVSEKFAGQTGPCPKCKQPIKIPAASEELVIHGPDELGPRNAEGVSPLKPLEREETETSPVRIAVIVAFGLVAVVAAFVLGRMTGSESRSPWLIAAGAIVLGPPVAVAAYSLLRDPELEAYRGSSLWLRAVVCGLFYAALWGVYAYVKGSLFEGDIEMFQLVFIAPALIAAGGVAAIATLDLDYLSGTMHYGVFVLISCCLRWIAGMPVY